MTIAENCRMDQVPYDFIERVTNTVTLSSSYSLEGTALGLWSSIPKTVSTFTLRLIISQGVEYYSIQSRCVGLDADHGNLSESFNFWNRHNCVISHIWFFVCSGPLRSTRLTEETTRQLATMLRNNCRKVGEFWFPTGHYDYMSHPFLRTIIESIPGVDELMCYSGIHSLLPYFVKWIYQGVGVFYSRWDCDDVVPDELIEPLKRALRSGILRQWDIRFIKKEGVYRHKTQSHGWEIHQGEARFFLQYNN